MDLMLNRLVLYQTLPAAVGRTRLYQSSGAFGFRDQLLTYRCCTPARTLRARSFGSRRHTSSAPVMCSLVEPAGRTRRAHAVFQTICSGCRIAARITSSATG